MAADRLYAEGDSWRPSARQFNFWTEGARAALQGRPGVPVNPLSSSSITIPVINTAAGTTLNPNDLVIYHEVIDEQQTDFNKLRFGPEFKCEPITSSLSLEGDYQYGVLLDALAEDESGLAIIMGPAVVKLRRPSSGLGATSDRCSPKLSARYVETEDGGVWPILWEQSVADPTADHWAVIMLTPVNPPPECNTIYDLRFLDNPSAGWGKVDVTYNSVTETIQLDYDFTRTDVLTAINAHSEFVAASVTATSAFDTGVLNGGNVCVRLPTGATMVRHSDSLTPQSGGRPPQFVCWISGPCG